MSLNCLDTSWVVGCDQLLLDGQSAQQRSLTISTTTLSRLSKQLTKSWCERKTRTKKNQTKRTKKKNNVTRREKNLRDGLYSSSDSHRLGIIRDLAAHNITITSTSWFWGHSGKHEPRGRKKNKHMLIPAPRAKMILTVFSVST